MYRPIQLFQTQTTGRLALLCFAKLMHIPPPSIHPPPPPPPSTCKQYTPQPCLINHSSINLAINRSPCPFHRIRCCKLPCFSLFTNPISGTSSPHHPKTTTTHAVHLYQINYHFYPQLPSFIATLPLFSAPQTPLVIQFGRVAVLASCPRLCDRTSFARTISNGLVAPVTRQFTNVLLRFSQILHYFKPHINPKYLVSH